jgi:hypothetical protein
MVINNESFGRLPIDGDLPRLGFYPHEDFKGKYIGRRLERDGLLKITRKRVSVLRRPCLISRSAARR